MLTVCCAWCDTENRVSVFIACCGGCDTKSVSVLTVCCTWCDTEIRVSVLTACCAWCDTDRECECVDYMLCMV